MTKITTDELVHILQIALEGLREDVDADLLASKLLCLTTTYEHPGLQQLDLGKHIKGLSSSSASRHIMDWSEYDKKGKPGVEFVQQRPDPAYRRRNLLFVTPKGQQYLNSLTDRVNKSLEKRSVRAVKSA
ncbi:hypothetical protein [Xanthomonas cannabis]|uniref:hypothetical protein n=1 Tax=Xanthomonas cannabis TaxID=1885674 RepID=UPI00141B09F6|nr:hypothetical protein [Xanthomonas cannabis]NIK19531.1 DNA-binding MarR family transcriptional regulator [Xanthomonas cannabis]